VVRPRSCRVIYYCDTPALEIRHQLFDRVNSVAFPSKISKLEVLEIKVHIHSKKKKILDPIMFEDFTIVPLLPRQVYENKFSLKMKIQNNHERM
jgi:hypothetical protein